jgi:hypothetical protein
MKKTVAITALALAAWSGTASSAGLGLSIQSGDPTIYIPIDIKEKFRLEPYISYTQNEFEEPVFGPSSSYTIKAVEEFTSTHIGIGAFWLAPFGESVRAYVGARFAFISTDSEYRYDNGSRPPGFNAEPDEFNSDGISFEPTVGLEYRFTERFSIAGEAKLVIASLEAEDADGGDLGSNDTVTTDTNVLVRFRF